MKRRHIFEFGDQPWLKGWVREGYLDCLTFVHKAYQPYYHLTDDIVSWAKSEQTNQILDLGSGSGEQVLSIVQNCKERNLDAPQFVLSDLYPDLDAYARIKHDMGQSAVDYVDHPLSAFEIEGTDIRKWTIFTAFHHFSPPSASKLLQQLTLKGDGLCILELTQRNIICMLQMLMGLPANMLAPFFAGRFRLHKFLFTTIIPIIPMMVAFDGMVSTLRTYTKDEILNMLPPECRDEFQCEYKEVKFRHMPSCKASMFLITRKRTPSLNDSESQHAAPEQAATPQLV